MKAVIIIFSVILVAFIAFQLWAMNGQKDIETYQYTVEKSYDDFEIRKYEETLFTTVTLDKNTYDESSSKGFGILAGYIFGGNDQNEKIAMTSPVAQAPAENIAMTSPVAQSGADGLWTVGFMMPRSYTRDTLPVPKNAAIRFVETTPSRQVVVTFSGWATTGRLAAKESALRDFASAQGLSIIGPVQYLIYDDPLTLPWKRRNEVALPIN